MVTVLALRATGRARRIGILDCDQHYGDGTEDIIVRNRLRNWVHHVTAGRDYPHDATRFLGALPGIVRSFADCALLLYQAGADPHIDDPLGGFLDDEQLAKRDAIVFGEARRMGLPVAWNLAGGYQEPLAKVLDVHGCHPLQERALAAILAPFAAQPGVAGAVLPEIVPIGDDLQGLLFQLQRDSVWVGNGMDDVRDFSKVRGRSAVEG